MLSGIDRRFIKGGIVFYLDVTSRASRHMSGNLATESQHGNGALKIRYTRRATVEDRAPNDKKIGRIIFSEPSPSPVILCKKLKSGYRTKKFHYKNSFWSEILIVTPEVGSLQLADIHVKSR